MKFPIDYDRLPDPTGGEKVLAARASDGKLFYITVTQLLATVAKGDKGDVGSNAYQIAVQQGFVGTIGEWITSLKGEKGDTGLNPYKGDAIPSTDPGNPVAATFYSVSTAGTYANFGGLVLPANSLGFIIRSGAAWVLKSFTVDMAAMNTAIVLKADKTYTDTELAKKAAKSDFDIVKDKTDGISIEAPGRYDFIDQYGFIAFSINVDGSTSTIQEIASALVNYTPLADFTLVKSKADTLTFDNLSGYEFIDQYGYIGFAIFTNGTTTIAQDIANAVVNYVSVSDIAPIKAITELTKLDATGRLEYIDDYGFVGAAINSEGKLESTLTLDTFNSNGVLSFSADGDGIEIIDQYGYILMKIDRLGAEAKQKEIDTEAIYDITHAMMYGQSNAISFTQGVPYSERNAVAGIYTFEKGSSVALQTDAQLNNVQVDDNLANNAAVNGWTAASQMARSYKQFLNSDPKYAGKNYPGDLFISAPGQGATGILGLSKGTTPYNNLLKAVQKAQNWAVTNGKSHYVPVIAWLHGEYDNTAYMSKDTYKTYFLKMVSDLNTDIKAITGQAEDIKFIIWQMNSIYSQGSLRYSIALALLELATEGNKNIYLGATSYNLPFSDPEHMNAVGAVRAAAMHGYIMKRILIDKKDWKNIYAERFDRKLKSVFVKCHIPDDADSVSLEFDITNVSTIANYGFNLYDSAGAEIAITSVQIFRKNIIKITTSQDILSGSILTYGINGTSGVSGATSGPRGNVSDNRPAINYTNATESFLIKNYLSIFKTTLS